MFRLDENSAEAFNGGGELFPFLGLRVMIEDLI
jgi:hypothetical protein